MTYNKVFKYKISLEESQLVRNQSGIEICFEGEIRNIMCKEFEFDSEIQLTTNQVLDKVKGTKGICGYSGNFKNL